MDAKILEGTNDKAVYLQEKYMIKIKRVYEQPKEDDGYRVMVDRVMVYRVMVDRVMVDRVMVDRVW